MDPIERLKQWQSFGAKRRWVVRHSCEEDGAESFNVQLFQDDALASEEYADTLDWACALAISQAKSVATT
jgi:hypothetical protein